MVGRDEAPSDGDEPAPPTVEPTASRGWPEAGGEAEPDPTPPADELGGEVGPGSLLFGRHRVVRKLGAGGMGDVWLVRLEELDCERAVKLIVSGIASDPRARARFRAEARTMASLSHPNVVVFHDADLGAGRQVAYIEMEYIRGTSLDRLLVPGVAMPAPRAVAIVRQLCDALDAVHARGVVHRDLKPSNLMLVDGLPAGRDWLKVLDFGIAKVLSGGEGTMTGGFIGSFAYAAPEQAEGRAEVASDLYSAGVLLYQMLAGRRPFEGTMARVLRDHQDAEPPAFAEVRPDLAIPPALEAVVRRCLAKDPAARPRSALALADALADAIRADAPSTLEATPPALDTPIPPAKRPPAPPRRTRHLVALAGLALLVGLPSFLMARRPRPEIETKPMGAEVAIVVPEPPRATEPARPKEVPAPPSDPDEPPAPNEANPPPPTPEVVAGPAADPEAALASFRPTREPRPAPPARIFDRPGWPTLPMPAPPASSAAVEARPDLPRAREVAPKPDDFPRTDQALGLTLRLVPGGPAPFYLGATEVTQAVYRKVTGENPSVLSESGEHPVTNVTWLDAVRFCNGLSGRVGRPAYYEVDEDRDEITVLGGDGYRLPTGAEWVFACCQGRDELFSFGNDLGYLAVGRHAWYRGNSRPLGAVADVANRTMPHPVGLKAANPLGLHDLHGNVAEWCWDAFERAKGTRVIKGGSCDDPAPHLRARLPRGERWDAHDLTIGFRVARDASTASRPPAGRSLAVDRYRPH